MEIIDSPISKPNQKSIWKTVFRSGLFLGFGSIICAQILYRIGVRGVTQSGQFIFIATMFLMLTTNAIYSIKYQRDRLDGGYISFGKALLISAIAALIGLFILEIWNYIYATVINPDYIPSIKQLTVENMSNKLQPEELNQVLKGLDDMAASPVIILKNSLTNAATFGLLINVIVALFLFRRFRI